MFGVAILRHNRLLPQSSDYYSLDVLTDVLKTGREVWDVTHDLVEFVFLVGIRDRGIPRKLFLALL